jgi:hypothetical protein
VLIRDAWVPDQSHTVLDGLGDEVVGFYDAVERKLAAIGDPEISWRFETGETGFFRALVGKRRDLLVITHEKFTEYNVLLAARAHGTALHVAWMLMVEPRLAKDLRRALRLDAEPGTRFEIGSEMDAIDLMDFRAFLGITRLVLKHAVRELTDQEPEIDGPQPSAGTVA